MINLIKQRTSLYSLATGAAAALMPRRGLFPYAGAAALGLHMGDFLYRQLRRGEKQKREQGN